MQVPRRNTVVVTGASAGIGRAVATAFGGQGCSVALLARGRRGLEGAAQEVEDAGGTALILPVDVAEHAEVEDAAQQVEERLGPIDVWVNVAFTSVFAPVAPAYRIDGEPLPPEVTLLEAAQRLAYPAQT